MSLFIHLRSHSAFSLSLGALQIDDLIELAVQNNQPAIALTDNNNLFGALEFSEKSSNLGLKNLHK